MIGKGEFDRLEGLIGDWLKDGRLPLDFCADDDKRAPENVEDLDDPDPASYVTSHVSYASSCWKRYEPISFWQYQSYYLETAVEKTDLKTLFLDVCAEYHILIWNAGGWSDINSRANIMKRFQKHSEAGRHCVLLYCGDHDPSGLLMSDSIRSNLKMLENAVGWSPDEDQLTIDRFGLNLDFIEANNLLWIDGLETGSGGDLADPKHNDHFKPYVQDYLKTYCGLGTEQYTKDDPLPACCHPRKVEANALVVRPDAGRQLIREAIETYIDFDGIRRYQARLKRERQKVRKALPIAMRKMLDEQGARRNEPSPVPL